MVGSSAAGLAVRVAFFGGGGGTELDMLGAGFGFTGLLLRDNAGEACVFGLRFGFCESIRVDKTGGIGDKVGMKYCNCKCSRVKIGSSADELSLLKDFAKLEGAWNQTVMSKMSDGHSHFLGSSVLMKSLKGFLQALQPFFLENILH